jgi:hypothetical protein
MTPTTSSRPSRWRHCARSASEVTIPVATAPANESLNELFLLGSRCKVDEKVGSLNREHC